MTTDLRDGAEQLAKQLESAAHALANDACQYESDAALMRYAATFVRMLATRQIECALDRDAEAMRAMGFTPFGHRRV